MCHEASQTIKLTLGPETEPRSCHKQSRSANNICINITLGMFVHSFVLSAVNKHQNECGNKKWKQSVWYFIVSEVGVVVTPCYWIGIHFVACYIGSTECLWKLEPPFSLTVRTDCGCSRPQLVALITFVIHLNVRLQVPGSFTFIRRRGHCKTGISNMDHVTTLLHRILTCWKQSGKPHVYHVSICSVSPRKIN